ncbi:hypothetical protein KCTCHS21_27210 [Cohnella abietis]|uniref:Uncharacterized protein n=1 Tax=Cohnella abietis TaxID=2507935 RepID=A0A3T1D5D5_9BACL|nr:hypothetical protein KCTCHS21_27210 [Cohnella abietis]
MTTHLFNNSNIISITVEINTVIESTTRPPGMTLRLEMIITKLTNASAIGTECFTLSLYI